MLFHRRCIKWKINILFYYQSCLSCAYYFCFHHQYKWKQSIRFCLVYFLINVFLVWRKYCPALWTSGLNYVILKSSFLINYETLMKGTYYRAAPIQVHNPVGIIYIAKCIILIGHFSFQFWNYIPSTQFHQQCFKNNFKCVYHTEQWKKTKCIHYILLTLKIDPCGTGKYYLKVGEDIEIKLNKLNRVVE